jgi:hypothetical protein
MNNFISRLKKIFSIEHCLTALAAYSLGLLIIAITLLVIALFKVILC